MQIDDGSGAPVANGETTWENSRRFSGRMMVAGLACFLLMLIMFLVGISIEQGKVTGWIDLGKVIGVVGVVLFKSACGHDGMPRMIPRTRRPSKGS
jgi:hypothetical protein